MANSPPVEYCRNKVLEMFRRLDVDANERITVQKLREDWIENVPEDVSYFNEALDCLLKQGYLKPGKELFTVCLTQSGLTEVQRLASPWSNVRLHWG